MANIVKILWSKLTGHVPSSLVDGQIAINQMDKVMFYPDENGNVQSFNINTPTNITVNTGWPSKRYFKTNVVNALITTNSSISVGFQKLLDTDDNSEESTNVKFSTIANNGSFDLIITSPNNLEFGGNFKLNYKIN